MDGHRISDVATRTGFSAATLRYYEDIGLVPPARRTQAGYRVYDDRSVERLAFVARAKRLGLRLDDIAELARLWEQDECAGVQRRLLDLVMTKVDATEKQVDELQAMAGRLRAVAAGLGEEPQAGPCDEECACNRSEPTAAAAAGCTLDRSAIPARVAAWRALVARAAEWEEVDAGARLRFAAQPGLAAVAAELAQAEQSCCAFFQFDLRIAGDWITLEARAPDQANGLVDALLGVAGPLRTADADEDRRA